jgi:ribosomal protein S27E
MPAVSLTNRLPLPACARRRSANRQASPGPGTHRYRRHRPEQTLLYQIVAQHYPAFVGQLAAQSTTLPKYVVREFEDFLQCGRLEHGFLRVRCDTCHAEQLVAFSCKRRGFCPSCGARRMAESAALLVDEVLPHQPMRQWVLSVPFPLRFLFATRPGIMGEVLGIVYRVIATHLIQKAGFTKNTARTGAVTLIQRFGSALNLNIHFHMLFLDGVYVKLPSEAAPRFVPVHCTRLPARNSHASPARSPGASAGIWNGTAG